MKNPILLLLPVCALLLVPDARAQSRTFAVDPKTSEVAFSLGDVLHSVHGTFHIEKGAVQFDASQTTLSGLILVVAGSGDSGSEKRDRKMNTEVLDVSRFTEISFAPHSYQGVIAPGDSTIQVTGTFTLRAVPHELTVPLHIHLEGKNCTAKTHFAVPYVKWGLKDPSTFILRVDKEVQIDLTLVGTVTS